MSSISLTDHIYVVALFGIFLFSVFKSQPKLKQTKFETTDKLTLYWSNALFLYLMAGAAVAIWWFNGRDFATLGIGWPQAENVASYTLLAVIYLIWYAGDTLLKLFPKEKRLETGRRWRELTPFMPTTGREVLHGLHLAVCAGVTEEIVFRGYMINYFAVLIGGQSLFGSTVPVSWAAITLGILIPGLVFAASHRYSGWSNVMHIIWMSIAFGLIFVLSQSLLIVIVLHALIDIIANLLSPWLLAAGAAEDVADDKKAEKPDAK